MRDSVRILTASVLAAALAACAGESAEQPQVAIDTAASPAAAPAEAPIVVADVGFAGPESMLYDPVEDLYLVSNLNGSPVEKDGNGFISRVAPDGEVAALKWIEGGAPGVTLNAPKGMAFRGDTLLVADIDVVRLFDRSTGQPLGEWPIPGAAFLNDVAVGPDGTAYVSDTGILPAAGGMEPTGTDAVYRLDASGRPGIVAQGANLQNPNGVVATASGVVMVSLSGGTLLRLTEGAEPELIATLPAAELDGVVLLPDGSFLVSSWAGQAIYRVDPAGAVSVAVENISAPADIGYDDRRQRVLIPQLTEDRLEIHPLR